MRLNQLWGQARKVPGKVHVMALRWVWDWCVYETARRLGRPCWNTGSITRTPPSLQPPAYPLQSSQN